MAVVLIQPTGRVCYPIFTRADFTRVLGTGTGSLITQYLPDCFSGYRDLPDTYPATHQGRKNYPILTRIPECGRVL
jgi:hypothetical protein